MTSLFAEFAAGYDFALDDYQVTACTHLTEGRGVLVAAPTGGGHAGIGADMTQPAVSAR